MKTAECLPRLAALGISHDDATALRRIAMTLSRWSELECGTANGGAIERDETTGKPYWTYDAGSNGKRGRYAIPDRERGAEKRLAMIMARYPTLQAYVQGDCRGAPLYILRPGDVPEGADVDSYYSRGIAVYK
jgi:hypothetical protein